MIAVDFDGTIAATGVVKQQWLQANHGVAIAPWQCSRSGVLGAGIPETVYDEMLSVVCDAEHTLQAPPCPGSVEGIRKLVSVDTLCVLTDRGPRNAWIQGCTAWLKTHGVLECFSLFLSTEDGVSKGELCSRVDACAMIDDDVTNHLTLDLATVTGILYWPQPVSAPQTPCGVIVVSEWQEIVAKCVEIRRRTRTVGQ
jgi:hypothetical protein